MSSFDPFSKQQYLPGGAVNLDYILNKGNHQSPLLHQFGGALLEPSVVTSMGKHNVASIGQSDEVARADHAHGLALGFQMISGVSNGSPSLITSNTALSGTQISVTPVTNSLAIVMGVFDFDATVVGYGLALGYLQVDDNGAGFADSSTLAVFGTLANMRATVAQQWPFFLFGGHAYTFRLAARKTVGGGTVVSQAFHTTITAWIMEG